MIVCPECMKQRGPTEEKSCTHGCFAGAKCVECGKVKTTDGQPYWSCITTTETEQLKKVGPVR